jgi:hypothetical protein
LLVSVDGEIAPCDPNDTPNNCGFYGSPDEVFQCTATCSFEFDLCGICDGLAPLPAQSGHFPTTGMVAGAKMGGSVANWNGTVAVSQHILQTQYYPLPLTRVYTYNLNHATGSYGSPYILPSASPGSLVTPNLPDGIPPGRGFALVMSEDYLVVGSHDSTPRTVQLWVRSTTPPWTRLWSAADPCPGTYFGFSVAIDENVPQGAHVGIWKVVAAGNPAAFLSGRVFIYFTNQPSAPTAAIAQTLQYLDDTFIESICFGDSVSSDSGLLAVGAPSFSYMNQTHSGMVFIYEWDSTLGLQGEYVLITQIPPPVPTFNGGFGLTVGVWDNVVIIGDNQKTIYEYTITGVVASPVLIDQPPVLLASSHLGADGISIWDQYIAVGDSEYVPSPSSSGTTFVYDRDPITPQFYRPMYNLDDPTLAVATKYGTDVDNRGGCFVASGVPFASPYGGVYIQNLCRDTCYGCDDVLNSCAQYDLCDVCLGDNSTCVDCAGTLNGFAEEDACGECSGDNSTCVIPTFGLTMNGLNCLDTVERNLTHMFQSQWGNAVWTIIAPLPTQGTASLSTIGSGSNTIYVLEYTTYQYAIGADAINLHAVITETGAEDDFVINVNIATCVDCFGVINGPAIRDVCGVCDGDNSTCDGCDGVPASGLVFDICGVCGGNGLSCVNITTEPPAIVNCTRQIIIAFESEPETTPVTWSIQTQPNSGTVYINPNTGVLQWVNSEIYMEIVWFVVRATSHFNSSVYDDLNVTFDVLNCTDCNGNQNGFQLIDVCGVCGGNGHSCIDCFGIPFGNATLDACNVCDGDGSTCNGPIPTWEFFLVIITVLVSLTLLLLCFLIAIFGRQAPLGPLPKAKQVRAHGDMVTTYKAVEIDPLLDSGPPLLAVQNEYEIAANQYRDQFVLPVPGSGIVDYLGDTTQTMR